MCLIAVDPHCKQAQLYLYFLGKDSGSTWDSVISAIPYPTTAIINPPATTTTRLPLDFVEEASSTPWRAFRGLHMEGFWGVWHDQSWGSVVYIQSQGAGWITEEANGNLEARDHDIQQVRCTASYVHLSHKII